MSSEACCPFHLPQTPTVIPRSPGCWPWAVDTVEICLGILCSVVTWEFTVQNDLHRGYVSIQQQAQQHADQPNTDDFLFHPSPGLMLFSCLVFGCSVSSFTQRRQSKDPLQPFVYAILLGGAALTGYARQESTHLILLGYLPWATCAAMTLSISGHTLYRLLKTGSGATKDEEKAQLLGG
ncbi:hypothetical protein QBC40DRAFT_177053 [Triangularia verruculosa]|uniref:Uncharacterized protein n=1 Tax=Triangularia verruculosa TaxID=2587418 RepID=A0AAN6XJU8_9PEZI|nr:hypothetical protein QBC40DRAFT_177053 [Triangularia verruculosa]